MENDLLLLIPEIIVLLTAVTALICEMLRLPRTALIISVLGLLLATGLTLPMLGTDTTVFSGTFRIDALSIWVKLILLPATALSLLLARSELAGTDREGTVYVLILMVTLASLILGGAGDTMMLILGILLSGLGSFALVAYPRTDAATEAAMKFFVFASVTSSIMIFGLTYWFSGTGTTLFNGLSRLNHSPVIAVLGLIAVVIGLGYKAALAPFHFWAPDAYEGAPVSIAGYLSVVPKIGAIFAFAQVLGNLPQSSHWPLMIAIVSILSMTLGYLAALVQQNVVRLLAYSSIAQAGYFLLGIVAVGDNTLALKSIIVFAAAYAAMNLGAFAIVMRIGRVLENYRGAGRKQAFTGVTMVIFLLSLVGIPPLAGFVGKFLLFGAAMDSGFTWLAIIAIINSVLSLAVYLRIIIPMYQSSASETKPELPVGVQSTLINLVCGITLFFTVAIGFFSQVLLENIGKIF